MDIPCKAYLMNIYKTDLLVGNYRVIWIIKIVIIRTRYISEKCKNMLIFIDILLYNSEYKEGVVCYFTSLEKNN